MAESRELQRAVRQSADANSAKIAARPTTQFWTTVTTVVPGGGRGGNALVKIEWRGSELEVAAYAASYTPAVGHRVLCDVVSDQISIAYRGIN